MAEALSLRAGGRAPAALSPVAGGGSVRPFDRPPTGGGADAARAIPVLPAPSSPTLSELFSTHPRDAGWMRLTLAQLPAGRPLLWVQERMAMLESGRVHAPGLPGVEIIHVAARDTRALLWTMEEGLRCTALGGVVGEAWGDPAALDFTATRRLAFASEKFALPCLLVRLGSGAANLSGARWRWRVHSIGSAAHPYDPRAPGNSRLEAELFRARGRPPGRWSWTDEAAFAPHAPKDGNAASPDDGDLDAAPVAGTLGEDRRRA